MTTFVGSGVVSSGLVVTQGDALDVESGGTASDTTLSSGGRQYVEAGGTAGGTVISNGGADEVYGSDLSATISNGGIEFVFAGGAAKGTTVDSGGFLFVESGASATGVAVNSGGTLVISGGNAGFGFSNNGTVSFRGSPATSNSTFGLQGTGAGAGTINISAGTLRVSFSGSTNTSGGPFVVAGGGRLELTSAGAAVGLPIDLADANTVLRIDGTTMPSDAISGFVPGERWIDLTGLSFGATTGVQVLAGNVLQISNGGTLYDLQLDPSQSYAGASFEVLSDGGGGTLIGLGSISTVHAGSSVANVTVAPGTFENVSGNASGTTTTNGGTQVVFSGGTASRTVLNGGLEIVFGSDTGATINAGGLVWVDSGGTASGATVNASGDLTVSSGGTATGTTVAGGNEIVSSGGTDFNATVSGGSLRVDAGGSASGATVQGGASLYVFSGGTASGTTVNSGGTLVVSVGTAAGTILNSGATEDVLHSGGLAAGTVVNSGGLLNVSSGGTASNAILSGGTEYVASGGTAQDVTFGGASGTLELASPARLTGTISNWRIGDVIDFVNTSVTLAYISGSTFTVAVGGGQTFSYQVAGEQSLDMNVQGDGSGGTDVSLRTASHTVLAPNTYWPGLTVYSGDVLEAMGDAAGTAVFDGGTLLVDSIGTANTPTLYGGVAEVYGSIDFATISSGAREILHSGGNARGNVIESGGIVSVTSGGSAVDETIDGGTEYVFSGGVVEDVTFGRPGGTLDLETPASLSGTISSWQAGDVIDFVSTSVTSASISGSTLAVTVSGGQTFSYQVADEETTAVGLANDGAGGTDLFLSASTRYYISSGAEGSGWVISSGVTLEVAGSAAQTNILSGGTLQVDAGGSVDHTALAGIADISGAANSTTVGSGGQEVVSSGGMASGDVVERGGALSVTPGGTGKNATLSGGTEYVSSGGVASDTVVGAGGMLVVSSGGTAESPLLTGSAPDSSGSFGGEEIVLSGGTADGTTLSASALLIISSGGVAHGAVVDSRTGPQNGGLVDFGTAFGTTVNSGGVEFVNSGGAEGGASVNSGGVLALSGGKAVGVSVNVGGSLVVSSGSLTIDTVCVSGNSTGGVEVVRGSAIATTLDNGAEQAVLSGGVANGTVVNGGGAVEFVFSGGSVSATTINSGGFEEIGTSSSAGGTAVGTTVNGGGIEIVFAGGAASGTIVNSGGRLAVRSGGTAIGTALSGGTEYVSSGGAAEGVTFGAHPATLALVAPTGLAGIISDLKGRSNVIDFVSTSITNASINGSTLTVTAGGQSFSYQLAGELPGEAPYLQSDGAGGTDLLLNIVPIVAASNADVTQGRSIAAASLFATSDADGDTIAEYAFWNIGTGGGRFVLNGVVQGINQEIDVSAAQLAQLSYQAGNGADTLWVRTNDGLQWSAWSNPFTVTATIDGGPVATPLSAAVVATGNQSFAASSLFTASDPDGDAITQYDLWNNGTGGGRWVVNGQVQAIGTDDYITAAQLAQTIYRPGSSTDTLWVRANDGTQWGTWSPGFTVTGPIDTPPVAAPTHASTTATHGQTFAAASLFTATDSDGDTIAQYDLWNTGAGGGRWVVNGQAQATGTDVYITAAQLAQTIYQPGSGTDTLWVRANDGTQWGAWTAGFTVTGPVDTAPVVTPANASTSATHGQTFTAANLFTASDADGDTITQYDLWNNGTGGGRWVVNGQVQATGTDDYITAAQLAQTIYQSGSGTDTLWVRANDGTQWGAWSQGFTVTAPVDTGPVVSPVSPNITTVAGQTFAASSLFSAQDPFGDPIAQYDFWDTGAGGGHFALNNQPLGANQDNIVTGAAQLAQTTYVAGSGTDTLWVRVQEGGQWSSWSQSFTVSDPPIVGLGETLELASAFSGTLSFAGTTGTLKIDNSSSFSGAIAGQLGAGDLIDLADFGAGAHATIAYSGNNSPGLLTVSDGTHTASIALLGQYSAASFVASSDGHGGTLVSDLSPNPELLQLAQPRT